MSLPETIRDPERIYRFKPMGPGRPPRTAHVTRSDHHLGQPREGVQRFVSLRRSRTSRLRGATFAMARSESRRLHTPFSKAFILGWESSDVKDTKRCALRMLHLHELQDDWYDDGSSAPTPLAMTSAVSLFNRIPSLMSVTSIFPTYEGGVLLEYENDCWDWSVEIFPDGEVEVHGSETTGDTDCREHSFRTLTDAMETIQQTVG